MNKNRKDESLELIKAKMYLPIGRQPWIQTLEDIRNLPEVPVNSR